MPHKVDAGSPQQVPPLTGKAGHMTDTGTNNHLPLVIPRADCFGYNHFPCHPSVPAWKGIDWSVPPAPQAGRELVLRRRLG